MNDYKWNGGRDRDVNLDMEKCIGRSWAVIGKVTFSIKGLMIIERVISLKGDVRYKI